MAPQPTDAAGREAVPPPPGTAVRRRLEGDLDACVAGLAETHRADGYPHHWPVDPGSWLRCEGALAAWVGVVDGRLAGHVVLAPGGSAGHPAAWTATTGLRADAHAVVSRLWVAPWGQHRGLGRRLLATATATADSAARGLWPVLDVMDHNLAAIALYESLGWARVGTRRLHFDDDSEVDLHYYVAPRRDGLRSTETGVG